MCLAAAAQGREIDHILDRAYVEDPKGELTLTQVQAAPAIPFQGILARGYTPATYWVRLTLRKPVDETQLVLRVRPQFLDEIVLFEPAPSASPRRGGDTHYDSRNEIISANHTFVITPVADAAVYWLRVRTTSSLIVEVSAMTRSGFERADGLNLLFYHIYLALLLVTLMWAGALLLVKYEGILVAYFVCQSVALLHLWFAAGLARFWWHGLLSAPALSHLTNLCIFLMPMAGLWFHQTLLRQHWAHRHLTRLLQGLMALPLLSFLLLALGKEQSALQFNMVVVLASSATLFAAALSVPAGIRQRKAVACLPKWVLVAYYSLFMAHIAQHAFQMLFHTPVTAWVFYASFSHALLAGIAMLVLLQWRFLISRRLANRRVNKMNLIRASLATERLRRSEQEQLISMLAHQLKTPLSVLRLSVTAPLPSPQLAQQASQAILDMNRIIEHCTRWVELEEHKPVLQKTALEVAVEVQIVIDQLDAAGRVQLQGPSGSIQTDPGLFRVVMTNLIENALKYGDQTAPVQVRFSLHSHRGRPGIRWEVANPAGSAGAPDPDQVFKKFYRSAGAQRQSGSGLGLFLVRKITEQLGGYAEYDPAESQIRFRVWLPA